MKKASTFQTEAVRKDGQKTKNTGRDKKNTDLSKRVACATTPERGVFKEREESGGKKRPKRNTRKEGRWQKVGNSGQMKSQGQRTHRKFTGGEKKSQGRRKTARFCERDILSLEVSVMGAGGWGTTEERL